MTEHAEAVAPSDHAVWLEFRAARIAEPFQSLELSFHTSAEHLALVGDFRLLFDLATARAELVSGEALLFNLSIPAQVRAGVLGVVRSDVLLPRELRVIEYLRSSAELSGLSGKRAQSRIEAVSSFCGLGPLHAHRLSALKLFEGRKLLLAAALLSEPRALLLERPMFNLDTLAERDLFEICDRISRTTRLIVSFSALPSEGSERMLFERCGYALGLAENTIAFRGEPSSLLGNTQRFVVTVSKHVERFTTELTGRNCTVEYQGNVLALSALSPDSIPERVTVLLPDGAGTELILKAAEATEAPVLELRGLPNWH